MGADWKSGNLQGVGARSTKLWMFQVWLVWVRCGAMTMQDRL